MQTVLENIYSWRHFQHINQFKQTQAEQYRVFQNVFKYLQTFEIFVKAGEKAEECFSKA